MLILPGCLSIIKRWCIARELKLLHHRVRAAFFSLEQKRHVNLELNKLRRLILIATWSSLVQCLETLLRLCIVLLLKWNLREVVLRFAELWIKLGRLLKCGLGVVKLLLLHQNLATQIKRCRLVRVSLIRLIH